MIESIHLLYMFSMYTFTILVLYVRLYIYYISTLCTIHAFTIQVLYVRLYIYYLSTLCIHLPYQYPMYDLHIYYISTLCASIHSLYKYSMHVLFTQMYSLLHLECHFFIFESQSHSCSLGLFHHIPLKRDREN